MLGTLYRFERSTSREAGRQVTMDGNQALAYGLIAAGVRYGAAYPITPWSSVMEILRAELPKYGGIFVQCEDELAAVAMALGFSFAGWLAVTGSPARASRSRQRRSAGRPWRKSRSSSSTSSAVAPSTGLPTNVEQSDLYQAIYGGHGDSPRVVLAAASVEDCFYIVLEAAQIARKYSTPVFVLSDASLATRIEAFNEPELESSCRTCGPTSRRAGRLQALLARGHHAPRAARHPDARRQIPGRDRSRT